MILEKINNILFWFFIFYHYFVLVFHLLSIFCRFFHLLTICFFSFQEIPFQHIWSGNQNNLHCSFSLEMMERGLNKVSCKIQVYQKAILSNRQVLNIFNNFKENKTKKSILFKDVEALSISSVSSGFDKQKFKILQKISVMVYFYFFVYHWGLVPKLFGELADYIFFNHLYFSFILSKSLRK
jgi:hypothetical protein